MNGLSSLTCLILSGGMGTRLRSLVSDRPKILADVNGRPFVSYILEKLDRDGAKDVVLCTGYMADRVEETLGDLYKGLSLRYSVETSALGTGGALRNALPMIRSDVVLVLNGDSLTDASFLSFVSWFFEEKRTAALLLTWMEETGRFGRVLHNRDGHIVSFMEKIESQGPGWINAGVYLMNRNLIEAIPVNTFYSLENDLFPDLSGKDLHGYPCRSSFIDIGTEASFLTAGDFVRRSEL